MKSQIPGDFGLLDGLFESFFTCIKIKFCQFDTLSNNTNDIIQCCYICILLDYLDSGCISD
jgi:hypothetical protein